MRAPEPHLVIDTSLHSDLRDPRKLGAAIRHALAAFPNASTARVTFANYESHPYRGGAALPISALDPATILAEAGDFRGGFLESRAIKSILVQQSRVPLAEAAQSFPAIIILRGSSEKSIDADAGNLAEFARLLPDHPGYWQLEPDADDAGFHAFDPGIVETNEFRSVRVFERGHERFFARADEPAFFVTSPEAAATSLTVYDPRSRALVPLPVAPATDALASGAAIWPLVRERLFAPAKAGPASLGALLAAARKAGALVPSTALMVVENSAQWKMLALTEKKSLKGHEALALAETSTTPEPGTLALLAFATLAFLFRKRWLRSA